MSKDYILFVHGVNVRESEENERNKKYTYADKLFQLIQGASSSPVNLIPVTLYWGDVNKDALSELTDMLEPTKAWEQFWFKDFRKKQLLQFVGDAALYISRHVGSKAVDQLAEQAFKGLENYKTGDRVHLVSHSWGTVILFDVLFAARWDNKNVPDNEKLPGYDSVQKIRAIVFGIEPDAEKGIQLASIHTMGSPITLFSLITIIGKDTQGKSTHDLTPGLKELLKKLHERDREKLPWLNFVHPGDPIAWPLEEVIKQVIDADIYVNIEDVITYGSGGWEFVARLVKQYFLALVNGGSAHGSYWTNKEIVAQRISKAILKAVVQ